MAGILRILRSSDKLSASRGSPLCQSSVTELGAKKMMLVVRIDRKIFSRLRGMVGNISCGFSCHYHQGNKTIGSMSNTNIFTYLAMLQMTHQEDTANFPTTNRNGTYSYCYGVKQIALWEDFMQSLVSNDFTPIFQFLYHLLYMVLYT